MYLFPPSSFKILPSFPLKQEIVRGSTHRDPAQSLDAEDFEFDLPGEAELIFDMNPERVVRRPVLPKYEFENSLSRQR